MIGHKLTIVPSMRYLLSVPLTVILASVAFGAMPSGFLDVTAPPYSADPTGVSDSTAALQTAINAGRDQGMVVWLPSGTYRVSQRLEIDQPDNQGYTPVVLMGSTVDPQNRATIYLAPNSPGFQNPNARRAMIHYFNIGTADNESGNTDLYDQAIIGVDLKIGADNDGAVALRMQSAEGSTIQDVNIDLTEGGHTGIWGIPGSGGSTHRVTITGGVIGIDTIKPNGEFGGSQPTPVITGSTFLHQSGWAIRAATRGPLVLVGCRFERNTPETFFHVHRHWAGQPFDGSLQIIDSVLAYADADPGNTVISMGTNPGRSFFFDNVFVQNASQVWTPTAPATPAGWHHFSRLAVEVRPQARSWGQGLEVVWQNGAPGEGILVEGTTGLAPPDDLQTRHQWAADFPTWEHPGVIDVTTLGAVGDGVTDNRAVLQAAIDTHETLFFPKGVFAVSGPLDLRPDTKLLGAYSVFSTVTALSTPDNRFGGVAPEAPDAPIIRSADTANAETWLAFIQIQRLFPIATHSPVTPGNHALEWRSGGASLLRHVMLESRPSINVQPYFIAKTFYGYNTDNSGAPDYRPINPNHPQQSFLPGDHAWPNATPNVIVRGHGGGRWFGFWFHGRQALRQETPFLRVENTSQPIHFYHLHLQQQDSRHHAEFYRAANVSIYGVKGEVKGAILHFEQTDNIRVFGLSGRLSSDASYFDQHVVRFLHSTNFSLSGFNDTIEEGSSTWFGGEFDRWIHANILAWRPLDDVHGLRPTVSVPSIHRPLLYLRGAPSAAPVVGLPLIARITGPADGTEFAQGQAVTLTGVVTDRIDGDVSTTGRWISDRDGLLGQGASLVRSNLSPGRHVIHFEASNERGDYSTESRTITVHPFGATLTYEIVAEADTTVRGGAETNTNFGSDITLRARSVENSESLLRFTLPSNLLGDITAAQLSLHLGANDPGTLVVHQLADLSWNEMTVTGATRPGRGSALGEISFAGNQTVAGLLDVSDYVLNATGDQIGFAATSANFLRLRSRESVDPQRHPRLLVTTTIPVIEGPVSTSFQGGAIGTADNWSNGLPLMAENKTGTINTDGSFSGSIASWRVVQTGGTLISSSNRTFGAASADAPGTVWALSGGVLNLGSASLNRGTVGSDHAYTLNLAGGSISAGAMQVTTGAWINVSAGSISLSGTLSASNGRITFLPGQGSIQSGAITTNSATRIDFVDDTRGTLTISGLGQSDFETLWNQGRLRRNGTNSGSFADHFTVQGSTLSLKPSDPYEAWTAQHGLTGNAALPDTDLLGDGFGNFLRYALGGTPTSPASQLAPVPALTAESDQRLTLTFTRVADPALIYEVWATSDLTHWDPTPIWTSTGAQNVPGEVTVTDPLNLTNHTSRFLQLRVRK